MSILDFFKPKKNTAATAKNRLEFLVKQTRAERDAPDYLPMMQRELTEVILKYVDVGVDAVNVEWHKEGDQDFLAISVNLPERGSATG